LPGPVVDRQIRLEVNGQRDPAGLHQGQSLNVLLPLADLEGPPVDGSDPEDLDEVLGQVRRPVPHGHPAVAGRGGGLRHGRGGGGGGRAGGGGAGGGGPGGGGGGGPAGPPIATAAPIAPPAMSRTRRCRFRRARADRWARTRAGSGARDATCSSAARISSSVRFIAILPAWVLVERKWSNRAAWPGRARRGCV